MKTITKLRTFFFIIALTGLIFSMLFNSVEFPELDGNTIAPFLILVLFPFVIFIAVKVLKLKGATRATQNH
jgi:hypothetical protein